MTMVAALTLIFLLVCWVFDWNCCNGRHRAICLLCTSGCCFLFHLSRETKLIHSSGICLIYPALIQEDEENNIWNEGNVYHDISVNETTKWSALTPWRWRTHVAQKQWKPPSRLNSVIIPKTTTQSFTTKKTSNLIFLGQHFHEKCLNSQQDLSYLMYKTLLGNDRKMMNDFIRNWKKTNVLFFL